VLADDPREPKFIGTVSRHGYRFVFPDVREEEEDDGAWPPAPGGRITGDAAAAVAQAQVTLTHSPREATRPLKRATRAIAARWTGATAGAALAGVVAGALGGLILASAPGTAASFAVVPVLALIGACCGAIGGAGVGCGLAAAEEMAQSYRTASLVLGGAIGGGAVGTAAQWLARWSLAALLGVRLDVGGSVEGIIIGAAAGLGYGLATSRLEGGAGRWSGPGRRRIVPLTSAACGLAALLLTTAGWPLVGGTIHAIASGLDGSQVALTPLGRLIGETDFGTISSAIIGTGEGVLFGAGLANGLTRRT
jgi:hypothetical protein